MDRKVYQRFLLFAMVVYIFMWCVSFSDDCKQIGPGGECLDRLLLETKTDETTTLRQITTTVSDFTISVKMDPFENALKHGKRRPSKGFLTIGIPTMKRPANHTYLWQTLDSLLSNSNDEEKNDTVLVIFLSDFDKNSKKKLEEAIVKKYAPYVNSGLIHIIEAPRDFYPSLDNLKRTYGHPTKQVKWRSKQNIDYAFMMRYSSNISEYYLQLEDDVTTVPEFIPKIKYFMKQQGKHPWVCLEFSELGYIGKLYHSTDLEKLANLLVLFYNEQPNDVTYLHFNQLMTQFKRKVIRPTIFQHHGYHSTLEIKKTKLQDTFFDTSTNVIPTKTKTQAKTKVKPQKAASASKKTAPVPKKAAPVPKKAVPAPKKAAPALKKAAPVHKKQAQVKKKKRG